MEDLPWLPAAGKGYEEWYFLDGSAALDPLNEAAIGAGCREPHDQAAELAAGGTAGLYRLRLGERPGAPRTALWFGKPSGMSYDALHGKLRFLVARGTALWGRQMVLGPTPEFCLHSDREVVLPAELPSLGSALRRVWP